MAPFDTLTHGDLHHFATRSLDLSAENIRWQLTPHPQEQRVTLYLLAAFSAFVAILYWFPRPYDMLIHPWMLLLTAIHEAAHAFVVVVTGGHVLAIEIDLPASGATYWYPRNFKQKTRAEYLVAPAGYLTGGFVGAALVFAGFSILASKIAVFVLAGILLFALILVVKDRVAMPTILLALLIPIPLFLIEHARFLRYYILWSGAVVSVYNIVLCLHTLVFRIIPGSDAHVFSRLAGGSPRLWGLLWTSISFVFFALAVLGGILAFHEDSRQQIREGQRFLPT